MKNPNNIVLYIITALYLGVHFVPDFGGADVMGAQWLYTSGVDVLVLVYFLFNQNRYSEAITSVFSQKLTLIYSFYFVWALASISYAINPTEAIVCLARLASTFFIYTNFAILLYKKEIKNYWMLQNVQPKVKKVLKKLKSITIKHSFVNIYDLNLLTEVF